MPPSATDVQLATKQDVKPLAQSLARAFEDDPVMAFLFPQSGRRLKVLEQFFAMELAIVHVPHDATYRASGMEGGALWAPPGQWRMTNLQLLRAAPRLLRCFGARVPVALRSLSVIEKAHPTEPHWYLAVLGTAPEHQGKGWGSRLLAPVLEQCDTEGLPAYLESSKFSNIAFYNRHGFEVTEELSLGANAPSVWGMWREPR